MSSVSAVSDEIQATQGPKIVTCMNSYLCSSKALLIRSPNKTFLGGAKGYHWLPWRGQS